MQNKESITEGTNRDTYKKETNQDCMVLCEVLPRKRLMEHWLCVTDENLWVEY